MEIESGYTCGYCGEWVDTVIDPSAGTHQSYVEDCQVCCRPNVLQIHWDSETGTAFVSAEFEG